MLDIALGLEIGIGNEASMARQDETLLDILIRLFADKLVSEVRRGLPKSYIQFEEDLPNLRGRLDVDGQFTTLAVRPDRLACPEGTTLLFSMNDLFESCVAVLLKRAVEPLGFEVTVQGGLRYCLEELDNSDLPRRALFRTRPDVIGQAEKLL